MLTLLLLVAGHTALWVGIYNRLHGIAVRQRVLRIIDKLPVAIVFAAWVAFAWQLATKAGDLCGWRHPFLDTPWLAAYSLVCLLAAATAAAGWFRRAFAAGPRALLSNHTSTVDVAEALGASPAGNALIRLLERVPGNDTYRLEINEKHVTLPRLPAALDGLSVVHISDLHFTGLVTRPFFEFVVEKANALQGDLIVVTGDIIDSAGCIDWLPHTLGRLRSRRGAFFVLGNHDWRLSDVESLRRRIEELGLLDATRQCEALWLSGARVRVAGNEWPWFGPRPTVPARTPNELRLLLSHSPDQIEWARQRDFDLVLAGHNHGGQIRFPLIGPVITPSLYGVRYASGLFHEPPTVMHVSRGISGEEPLRLRCPPELTRIVLRCPESRVRSLEGDDAK